MTFDRVAEQYFHIMRNDKSGRRPLFRTIRNMESRYRNHLSPRIGERTLDECTAGALHRGLQSIVNPDG